MSSAIGLDIGTKSIKIVELEKEGNSWKLMGSGIVGYKGKSIEEMNDEKEIAEIGEIVKRLHKEAKISKRDAIISLPESQVFTRTIKFPMLTDKEISSAVKWEAEQYVPIPISEAIVQHKIIERREKDSPPSVIVLLIASPTVLVEKYMLVAKIAGLNVVAVETELMAIVRCLAPKDTTSLLVDFGARSTDMAIARNGNLVFSRSIATAGNAFTRAVAQNLGVEQVQAEEYKKTYGLSANQLEGKVKTALNPVVGVVVDEIKKAIHFYQSEGNSDAPKSIIITGGGAGLPSLSSTISKSLNLEIVVGNPFSTVKMNPAAAKSLANYSPFYSVAVGLAERGGA